MNWVGDAALVGRREVRRRRVRRIPWSGCEGAAPGVLIPRTGALSGCGGEHGVRWARASPEASYCSEAASPAAAELGESGQSGTEAAGTIWCGYGMGKRGAGKAGRIKGRAGDHDAGQRKEIPAISASFGRGRCAASREEKEGGR